MQINELPLPDPLVALIEARRWKRPRNLDRLAEAAGFKSANRLDFLRVDQMDRETNALINLHEQGFAETYSLLSSTPDNPPPDDPSRLDVRLAVVIANNWDEEGLCLDYRPGLSKPRVLAGLWPDEKDTPMRWRVVAKDFTAFMELAGLT
jgi:hypothetical protein